MKTEVAPAVCAHRSSPTGHTVGMFRLVEAYVKLNYEKDVVLVVQTKTMRRLNRLVREGVANPTIIVDTDDETKEMRDWPPGSVVVIPCKTREDARAKTILMREIFYYGFVWIFDCGECVGRAEESSGTTRTV